MPTLRERARHAWNAFRNADSRAWRYEGESSYYNPQRRRRFIQNERSIITALYTRIAIDVAQVDIRHVLLDGQNRYVQDVNGALNDILSVEANIDQTARAFKQDAVFSMLDEGTVALVPIDTDDEPTTEDAEFDIHSIRTGKIVQWRPQSIIAEVYNEQDGKHYQIPCEKATTAIIENPMYEVMNSPNSTLQRLIRKLNILDAIDEQSGSGKLDLIIQLPYMVRGQAMRERAEQRRKDLEMQLAGSKYGIAYADGTEKVTQLNRSVDNNLMTQIEYLTRMLYSQLGMTEKVVDGTADEQETLNYNNRTVMPIANAFVDEIKRKFLTKKARDNGQTVMSFLDPFRNVPLSNFAAIADTFRRNEITTTNELRTKIGMPLSTDPRADSLANPNMPASKQQEARLQEVKEEKVPDAKV